MVLFTLKKKQFTADELTGGDYVIVTHRYNRLDLLKAVTGKEEHTIDVSDTEEVLRVGGVSTLSKKANIDGFLAKWKLHADDVNGSPREYYQFNSDGDLEYGVSSTTELTPTAYHKVSSLGSKVKPNWYWTWVLNLKLYYCVLNSLKVNTVL